MHTLQVPKNQMENLPMHLNYSLFLTSLDKNISRKKKTLHPTHVTKRTKIALCRKSIPFYQCFYARGKMICDVHPGSRIFFPSPIPDSGVKRHRIPDFGSGSATLLFRLEGFRSGRQVWSCAADLKIFIYLNYFKNLNVHVQNILFQLCVLYCILQTIFKVTNA
jgi:hypothetical protein